MNTPGRGQALAEMNPFGRPIGAGTHGSWRKPAYPMVAGNRVHGARRDPSNKNFLVGFDPGTFLSTNKVAVAVAVALLAGGAAWYYGSR